MRLSPDVRLSTRDSFRQLRSLQARPSPHFFQESLRRKTFRLKDERCPLRTAVAQQAHQGARIHIAQPDKAAFAQPRGKVLFAAPVRRCARTLRKDATACMDARSFLVLSVRPHIANVRKAEHHDLLCIGRIAQHFLMPAHRRVEAKLAQGDAARPDARAAPHAAVFQHQERGFCQRQRESSTTHRRKQKESAEPPPHVADCSKSPPHCHQHFCPTGVSTRLHERIGTQSISLRRADNT